MRDPKKMPWWKMLGWGFLVTWEDGGWRLVWVTCSMLTAMSIVDAVLMAVYGLPGATVRLLTIAAGTTVLAWLAARLHRRANQESVLEFYRFWKRGKKGRRP